MTPALMSAPATPRPPAARVTPDDLLSMEQKGLFELVDGELIEKPMASISGETAVIILNHLYPVIRAVKLGKLYSEVSFRCFPDKPLQVRRPDIAFVAKARLGGVPTEGHVPIRPDLCIEVVSPGDEVYNLDSKLADYKSAGVPLTWVFNPEQRMVRVFRPGKPIDELSERDTISGEEIIPGLTAVVGELFPDPADEPAA
jgi:Uma2 family endonuclease